MYTDAVYTLFMKKTMTTKLTATDRKLPRCTQVVHQGLGWDWASELVLDASILEKAYVAVRTAYLENQQDYSTGNRLTSAEAFDKEIDLVVSEQVLAWGTTRAFRKMSPAQHRLLRACNEMLQLHIFSHFGVKALDAALVSAP